MTTAIEISDDRELTVEEASLVRWLLKHGRSQALSFVPQLKNARVASRCGCGCASINFAINGVKPPSDEGIAVLADYEWGDADGRLLGAFVFAQGGLLAGLEIWSQDLLAIANELPQVDWLRPFGSCTVSNQLQMPT